MRNFFVSGSGVTGVPRAKLYEQKLTSLVWLIQSYGLVAK